MPAKSLCATRVMFFCGYCVFEALWYMLRKYYLHASENFRHRFQWQGWDYFMQRRGIWYNALKSFYFGHPSSLRCDDNSTICLRFSGIFHKVYIWRFIQRSMIYKDNSKNFGMAPITGGFVRGFIQEVFIDSDSNRALATGGWLTISSEAA